MKREKGTGRRKKDGGIEGKGERRAWRRGNRLEISQRRFRRFLRRPVRMSFFSAFTEHRNAILSADAPMQRAPFTLSACVTTVVPLLFSLFDLPVPRRRCYIATLFPRLYFRFLSLSVYCLFVFIPSKKSPAISPLQYGEPQRRTGSKGFIRRIGFFGVQTCNS